MDEGITVNIVLLDLSNIFDTLCRSSLLKELSTCEELAASGQRPASGVAQVSTLGTVLFNIFINYLYAKPECSISKFINGTYLGGA